MFSDQAGEAVGFGAHDEDDRALGAYLGNQGISFSGQAHDGETGVGELLQGAVQVDDLGHGEAGGRAGRGLPGGGGHLRAAAVGDDDTVRAESGGGTDDGPQIVGIGDLIASDNDAVFGLGDIQDVQNIGVLVIRQLQGDRLVDRAAREAVELDLGHLQHGDGVDGGEFEDLPQAVVALAALRDVRGLDRQPGHQRFEDGVAPDDPIAGRLGPRIPGLAALGKLFCLVGPVVHPVLRFGSRSAPGQALPDPPTGSCCVWSFSHSSSLSAAPTDAVRAAGGLQRRMVDQWFTDSSGGLGGCPRWSGPIRPDGP